MGSFFTNVQVYIGTRPAGEARQAVIQSVQNQAAADSFELVDPGEPPHRSILVGPSGDVPWIAVFDEATEDQDANKLRGLAAALSAPDGVAMGVLVHDSDILELCLCRGGAQVDIFNSRPDYFRPVSAMSRRQLAGRPTRWRDLLVDGFSPRDLRAAWQESDLPAEELLVGLVAPLLGVDMNWCATGYTYLDRGDHDFDDEQIAGLLRLGFRERIEPWDYMEGPPQLALFAGDDRVKIAVGEAVRVFLSAANRGGPAHGLYAVAWGPALEQGLLHLQSVRSIVRPRRGADQVTIDAPLIADRSQTGAPHRATLPEAQVGPGLRGRSADQLVLTTTESTGPDADGSMVGVLFSGMANRPGSGELYVAVAPADDKLHAATTRVRVTVLDS